MNCKLCALSIILAFLLASCSSKNQLLYLNDYNKRLLKNNEYPSVLFSKKSSKIQPGDILKIEVNSLVAEAITIFNKNINKTNNYSNLETMLLEGYRVDRKSVV